MRHFGLLQRFLWNMTGWKIWVQKLLDNQKEILRDKQKVPNWTNWIQNQIMMERCNPLSGATQITSQVTSNQCWTRWTLTSEYLDCHILLWSKLRALVFVKWSRRSRTTLTDMLLNAIYNKTFLQPVQYDDKANDSGRWQRRAVWIVRDGPAMQRMLIILEWRHRLLHMRASLERNCGQSKFHWIYIGISFSSRLRIQEGKTSWPLIWENSRKERISSGPYFAKRDASKENSQESMIVSCEISIRRDRTQSSFTTHSQLILSRRLSSWKLEKSYRRKYMRHPGRLQTFPLKTVGWKNWVQKLLDMMKAPNKPTQRHQIQ